MEDQLHVQNSLTGKKELFKPLNDRFVGMYVCGPTVYSDVHLGNCRTFTSFDVIYRHLKYLGYKIRYVRNITDVGHLEGDSDTGAEDKIAKKARLEQLEPMEVVQQYTNGFHDMMRIFNNARPSIEPRATGHIMEQIKMVQQIIDNGYGYIANGSVYFDTNKFVQEEDMYGQLSGRKVEDLLVETRENLKKQDEKRHPSDFAIWIKADASHLMRWESPWSVGFPGWHLECSAMSTKYLGENFDIHGGGGDLKFPHHENEIAQNFGACNCAPANYWLHTNMLLMNGRKMSKSDGNTITPQQLFTGDSEHISKSYSPMVVRFFMLRSHYRSTLDLTDDALMASEKGYKRLMEANRLLISLTATSDTDGETGKTMSDMLDMIPKEMNDDFNTPRALAKMFEIITIINSLGDGKLPMEEVSKATLQKAQTFFHTFIFDVFGLLDDFDVNSRDSETLNGVMNLVLDIRASARTNKDWTTSDKIRDTLNALEIIVKDGKDGTTWSKN